MATETILHRHRVLNLPLVPHMIGVPSYHLMMLPRISSTKNLYERYSFSYEQFSEIFGPQNDINKT